jgi:hypothetical protein
MQVPQEMETLAQFQPERIARMSEAEKDEARREWLRLRMRLPGATAFQVGSFVFTVNGVNGTVRQFCGDSVLVEDSTDHRSTWIHRRWIMRVQPGKGE